MTITVKDNKVFKVHKAIISSQSKFFHNACTKDFKEKKDANIDLSEQDPEAVEALLEYLYKCDYTRLTKDNVNALVLHVHVYQLAHMYDVAELKNVAAALFKEAAEKDWELPAFPLAIQEIYVNPEDDAKTLRKLVVDQASEHLETLLKDDGGEFAGVMTAFGEFGKDLCKASFHGPKLNRNIAGFWLEHGGSGLSLKLMAKFLETDVEQKTYFEGNIVGKTKGAALLLDSGEYSDMSVTCKQKTFKVHKAVVCTRSRFFRNAMKNGTFKVSDEGNLHPSTLLLHFLRQSNETESETGKIDLSDDDPLAVEAVLRFVYQGSYSALAKDKEDAMVLHTRVYNLADMYDIKNLKAVAASEFKKLANKNFKLPAFPLAIKEIYENCPADDKTLRDIVIQIVLDHYNILLEPNGGDFASIKMTDLGDFAKDLLHPKVPKTDVGQFGKIQDVFDFFCEDQDFIWRVDLSGASEEFKKSMECPTCDDILFQESPNPEIAMLRSVADSQYVYSAFFSKAQYDFVMHRKCDAATAKDAPEMPTWKTNALDGTFEFVFHDLELELDQVSILPAFELPKSE
ncbi:hypothetical protein FKW77_007081 [Venturia effusa]|uniref:BTB domain-containing protein n=1 Tax=Venturia effusa TaxID=50376 RepID=A0A517L1K0_9PEZI|nr:hypothetical protein FKW77_007081 [Venturia effusa]